MKIKKIAKDVIRGIYDTVKAVVYIAPFWLPTALEAKAFDLQATKETILKEYENAAWIKFSKEKYDAYTGMISDLGNSYHFNIGVNSTNGEEHTVNAAVLGKRLGLEVSADFNGNKALTLDGIVAGIGLSATGSLDGGKKTVKGSVFRAEEIGKGTIYGKIEGNKDNASASGLGFYVGPKLGNATIIPLAFGSKSLTSDDYSFMPGIVILGRKVSATITTSTTDFKEWKPSLKFKYDF